MRRSHVTRSNLQHLKLCKILKKKKKKIYRDQRLLILFTKETDEQNEKVK